MATITNLKTDQILYDVKRQKMGNTTITQDCLYTVKVIELDLERSRVLASWNGNPPRYFYERHVKAWKVNKPEPKHSAWGAPSY